MTTRYAQAPEVLSRQSLGRVLVRLRSGDVVTLPGTAAEVWSLLAPPRRMEEIVDELAERYAAERAQLISDVGAVLDDLVDAGLVVRSHGSSELGAGG